MGGFNVSAQICPSCLSQKFDQGRCQNCGFNRAEYWPAQQALPLDTMVGKYRIGLLKASSRQSQVYTGIDVAASSPVLIEEFLPAKVAGRHPEDPRVLLAKNDAQTQQRFQMACRMLEASVQNRPLRKLAVFRANNTVYTVFAPMANVPVDAQCEALADNPVYFRGPDDQPVMTINALPIPPMPLQRDYSPNGGNVRLDRPEPLPPEPVLQPAKPKKKALIPLLIVAAVLVVVALGCALVIPRLLEKPVEATPVPSLELEETTVTPEVTEEPTPTPTPETTAETTDDAAQTSGNPQETQGLMNGDMIQGAPLQVPAEDAQESVQPAPEASDAGAAAEETGDEKAVPAISDNTPNTDTDMPTTDEPQAVDDANAPGAETTAPADGTNAPGAETTAPADDANAYQDPVPMLGDDEPQANHDEAQATPSESVPGATAAATEPAETELPQPTESGNLPQFTEETPVTEATEEPVGSVITSREGFLTQLRVAILKETKTRIGRSTVEVKLPEGTICGLRMKKDDKNKEWIFSMAGTNGYDVNLELPEELLTKAATTMYPKNDSTMRIYTVQGDQTVPNPDVQVMLRVWTDYETLREGDYVIAGDIRDLIEIEKTLMNQKDVSVTIGGSEDQYCLIVTYQDKAKMVYTQQYPIGAYVPFAEAAEVTPSDTPSPTPQATATSTPTATPTQAKSRYDMIDGSSEGQSLILTVDPQENDAD